MVNSERAALAPGFFDLAPVVYQFRNFVNAIPGQQEGRPAKFTPTSTCLHARRRCFQSDFSYAVA
jgi:hypothetical protein